MASSTGCTSVGERLMIRAPRRLPSDAPAPRAIPRCAPEFFEQPHVLDRDDGLVGEGFQKSDLFLRERTDLRATNHDHADRLVLAHQRCGENSSNAEALGDGEAFRKLSCDYGEHIFNVDHLAVEDRATNRRVAIDGS